MVLKNDTGELMGSQLSVRTVTHSDWGFRAVSGLLALKASVSGESYTIGCCMFSFYDSLCQENVIVAFMDLVPELGAFLKCHVCLGCLWL